MEETNKLYVVTRNGRRIEEKNYEDKNEAEARAEQLVQVLKKWKDPDQKRVRVIATNNPKKIR
jgi:hypothetical protein